MVFGNIVVAFDGSSHAKAAVKKAVEISQLEENSKITIILISSNHNAQLAESLNMSGFDPEQFQLSTEDIIAIHDKAIAEETDKLDRAVSSLVAPVRDKVSLQIVPGNNPSVQIVETARKLGADVIVMGSRGLGAVRGMLGSVSFAVLRESEIPVLVVK
ncbi:MAG: universal stress protein [Eggerthellales bacterium]|nr:universal stress protein [Eggerthellales bacterium]